MCGESETISALGTRCAQWHQCFMLAMFPPAQQLATAVTAGMRSAYSKQMPLMECELMMRTNWCCVATCGNTTPNSHLIACLRIQLISFRVSQLQCLAGQIDSNITP